MASRLHQLGHRGAVATRALFSGSNPTASWWSIGAAGGSGNNGAGRGDRPVGTGPGGSGHGGGGSRFGRFSRQLRLWSMVALGSMTLMAGSAQAAKKQEPPAKKDLTIDDVTTTLWNVAGPVLTNLGFSGCIGVAAGIALKKVGQFLAVFIGLSFMALQGLAYQGYISVNWTNVHKQINEMMDINHDGKVDELDFKLAVGGGLGVLAQGVPSVGGFLAGFLMGVRM